MKRSFLFLGLLISLILSLTCCVKASLNIASPDTAAVSHLENSTVALVRQGRFGDYYTYCSGVWVSDYYIVTARHCVADDDTDEVTKGEKISYTTFQMFNNEVPSEGPSKRLTAVVIADSETSDLALLKSEDDTYHQIAGVNPMEPIQVGSPVAIMGHTSGLEYTYMTGIISQVRVIDLRPLRKFHMKMLHVTSLAWHGNSGGGVYDEHGHLIGICSFLMRSTPGMSFFIHRDEVVKLLRVNNVPFSD